MTLAFWPRYGNGHAICDAPWPLGHATRRSPLRESICRSNSYMRSHSRFPIPDSRFPIPDSRFPIPNYRLPIPDSRFPKINGPCKIVYQPDHPLDSGARLWIETFCDIHFMGGSFPATS
ncbi:hypothetical protein [Moorena sp. SIO3A2]|uniref:hypothetical protein n=1 Tax=Moorena sp. SIO3A2 TaxID=2607841 RepID=UPI00257B8261|nr:hypothetical protein [Moorena sp. SIO3A2]